MSDFSVMPDNWMRFAGLTPEDFPVVPEPAFPPAHLRFTAFHLTPPEACRVIILGLDPYQKPGEAHGLSFSVPNGQKMPPSLRNIYKEMEADLGIPLGKQTDLTSWATSGVLLMNCFLSVEPQTKSKSHSKLGWHKVTDKVITALGHDSTPRVFILWGNDAKAKRDQIDETKNHVIASSHPSPIGGSCNKGFFGSKPFSRANEWLSEHGMSTVDWRIPANDLFAAT